jgi:diguanylate cyclase (GGDEF)-like protein
MKLLMPENPRRAPGQLLISLLASGSWKLHTSVSEFEFLKKDGTLFPGELRLSSYSVGAQDYIMGQLRDISERKREELLERDRVEVVQMLAGNQPLKAVLSRLTKMIEGQLPGSMSQVMLRRDDRLYHAAASNLPDSYIRAVDGIPIGPTAGSFGAAVSQGKTVVADDVARDAVWDGYRELALEHNLRSSCSVPIYSREGVIGGTLTLYDGQPHPSYSAQLGLLQMASRLASVAIEQRELTSQLAYQAQHDALTGLYNRFSFEDRVKLALAQGRRDGGHTAILWVDLDRFKLVNDSLGHIIGDSLLQKVAKRLVDSVRETDIVARWGGDEFVVGLLQLRAPRDATLVAQKILDALRIPFDVEGHEVFVTATIGIGVSPRHGRDMATLLRNTDNAMCRAKNEGKNNYRWYTPDVGAAASRRLDLETQLRHALERSQLLLHYQPQFELESGKLVGLEALLRWNHPSLGLVSPTSFIPIAEESGLIIPIGAWVLEETCRQIQVWQKAGRVEFRVAVNVSTLQFSRPGFVETVAQALTKTGVDPRFLELEMTESLVMRDVVESTPRMAKLRELGVTISIDDFGTGYSSLSCLQRLPIETLKIDQSFVRDMSDLVHGAVG